MTSVPVSVAQAPHSAGDPVLASADRDTFQSATAALQANHLDQAIEGFTAVTHSSPRFVPAFLNLGLALTQAGRNEQAAEALHRAIALRQTLRGAHLFLAIAEYNLMHLEPASDAIRKETALNPSDAQAWMWQGIIDLARGKLDLAVVDLTRASSLDPSNVDILYHRGRAALALSRASYETLFKIDPNSWHIHQILAEAAVEQGHDADAVEEFTQAIATAPPQGGLYEALGSSLWRTGKYDEAAAAYEKGLAIDPTDVITTYKLGCLRVDRGDAAGGKPLLERVEAADPSLTMTGYYLGRAASTLGDDPAAVVRFKQVIAENIDPDTTKQAYFQLSRSLRRLHDDPAAAAAQTQYRTLDQQSRNVLQEKLKQRQHRADRDTSIPAPSAERPSADAKP